MQHCDKKRAQALRGGPPGPPYSAALTPADVVFAVVHEFSATYISMSTDGRTVIEVVIELCHTKLKSAVLDGCHMVCTEADDVNS